jgi:hypothetical protein
MVVSSSGRSFCLHMAISGRTRMVIGCMRGNWWRRPNLAKDDAMTGVERVRLFSPDVRKISRLVSRYGSMQISRILGASHHRIDALVSASGNVSPFLTVEQKRKLDLFRLPRLNPRAGPYRTTRAMRTRGIHAHRPRITREVLPRLLKPNAQGHLDLLLLSLSNQGRRTDLLHAPEILVS